jgi:RNA polymerase sigma-70 factor (ECF subfamily)
MLGSTDEADDAVQEAWLRLSRSDSEAVDNLGGWLTTVVARVCLDMLRARASRARREVDGGAETLAGSPAGSSTASHAASPEEEAVLADSVGLALLVVLDTLAPAERLSFVLHDMFGVPFEEIASILGRSQVAARQLASRARRRVQSDPAYPEASARTQRQVVAAFLAASREGDFTALLRLLDPDVVLRADATALAMNASRTDAGAPALSDEVRGPDAVAGVFAAGARAARPILVDGLAGAVFSMGGRPRVVFDFRVRGGRVVGIELLADRETLEALELEPVPN